MAKASDFARVLLQGPRLYKYKDHTFNRGQPRDVPLGIGEQLEATGVFRVEYTQKRKDKLGQPTEKAVEEDTGDHGGPARSASEGEASETGVKV